jgi:hypothetical protein
MQDQRLNYATPQPAAPRRWLWRVLFVVAAIAALLLLIWFLFSPGDAPTAVF